MRTDVVRSASRKVWEARLRWWAPLAAFFFLAVIGGFLIEESARDNAQALRDATVQSCERVNVLRAHVNRQGRAMSQILLLTAARMEEGGNTNEGQIREFRMAASEMVEVPLTECEDVFPSFGLQPEHDPGLEPGLESADG